MRRLSKLKIPLLASLVACSGVATKNQIASTPTIQMSRSVANLNQFLNDPKLIDTKVNKLINGIFQAYLLGQVYLFDFDKILDKQPSVALKSSAYSSLLAIRSQVDVFEHDMMELYMDLVLILAAESTSAEQRTTAEKTLNAINNFVEGVKTNTTALPENLKPLVLTNLRYKQTHLYEDLKALHDASQDEFFKQQLYQSMVKMRASRLSFYKELNKYHVDPLVLARTVKEERKKTSFKSFEKEIKSLSKQMKLFISEIGRDTNSDTITPSAGPNGNISGKSFPQNTWSLTFDDGPGKTTDQLVTNLMDRKTTATFFMLAKQVENNPKTVSRINEAGFDIASHSYTHAQLTKVGPVQLEKEIGASKKVIEDKIGKPVKLFRLPYGAGVSVGHVRAKIAEHNLIHVFWTVDTLDWQDKNPTSIVARSLKQMKASAKNSGIILFHDIHSQSVTASTMLMDLMNADKQTICSVQGVVDQMNNDLPSCK